MELLNIHQLEFLTKLGMEEDTTEVMGIKFTLRTLTVEENNISYENPTKEYPEDGVARFNMMRIELLSRSITKINGSFVPENMHEKVKMILRKSQQLALNKLWDLYTQLVAKQAKKFEESEVALNEQVPPTPADVSPVVQMPAPPVQQEAKKPIVQNMGDSDQPINIVNPGNLMGQKK